MLYFLGIFFIGFYTQATDLDVNYKKHWSYEIL